MPLTLTPTLRQCTFELREGGRSTLVELDHAQCQLLVTPHLTDDGKITLRFTPHVNHGETTLIPRPLHEASGTRSWDLQAQQPSETYSKLSWEVTLATGEYVLIGTRLDRTDTLGQRAFLLTDAAKPVQRLLVLRTCRAAEAAPAPDGSHGKAPPLALQAGLSSARGVAP